MKRIILISCLLVMVGYCFWFVKHRRDERSKAIREQAYQAGLHEYSAVLRPGSTRDVVEDFLHRKKQNVRQLCCAAISRGVGVDFAREGFDDLVKIGHEPVPWFCSENNVYIAFEFNPKASGELPGTNASDVLKRISVFHHLEGCM